MWVVTANGARLSWSKAADESPLRPAVQASPPSQARQEMKAEILRHWRKGGKHALVMGDSVAEEFGDYLRDDLGIKVLFGKKNMRASAPEDHALQVSDSFREIRDDVDVKNAGVILYLGGKNCQGDIAAEMWSGLRARAPSRRSTR